MLRKVLFSLLLGSGLLAVGCASEVGNDGARVGGSCVVSSECHPESRCLTGGSWPGGYCAQACTTDEECPGGSVCVDDEGGICMVSCASDGECRSGEGGYACVERPGQVGPVMVCAAP